MYTCIYKTRVSKTRVHEQKQKQKYVSAKVANKNEK